MPSVNTSAIMRSIEKSANDPLQILGTQKKISFDETNLKRTASPTSRRDFRPEGPVPSSSEKNKIDIAATKPRISIQPRSPARGLVRPLDNDILSGRGAGVNTHPGNIFFRSLIQSGKDAYVAADPGEKKRIIKDIVTTAIERGMFLKQDPETELWIPISLEEAKRKTGQALRENAPAIKKKHDQIRQKLKQANQFPSGDQRSVCLQSMRKEIEQVPMVSPTLTQMTSNYVPPPIVPPPNPTQLSASHLLWSRMNAINEKQEQLKRKQRELEDEQSQIMQCFFQMSVNRMTSPMIPMDFLYAQSTSDSCSDSDSSSIYSQSHKKRRIIDARH